MAEPDRIPSTETTARTAVDARRNAHYIRARAAELDPVHAAGQIVDLLDIAAHLDAIATRLEVQARGGVWSEHIYHRHVGGIDSEHFHGCPTPTGRPFDCDYCQERSRSMAGT